MTDLDEIERLLAKATEGPWRVIDYDCGDTEHYDHNGPCPSIQAPDDQDCAIVHWDGFKQKYWSAANGNQRQIEANAALIVALRNAAPALIAELKALRERVKTRPWCETCGKDVPEVLCPTCAKWWNDNPPPSGDRATAMDELIASTADEYGVQNNGTD